MKILTTVTCGSEMLYLTWADDYKPDFFWGGNRYYTTMTSVILYMSHNTNWIVKSRRQQWNQYMTKIRNTKNVYELGWFFPFLSFSISFFFPISFLGWSSCKTSTSRPTWRQNNNNIRRM